jgi:hypothetical protein
VRRRRQRQQKNGSQCRENQNVAASRAPFPIQCQSIHFSDPFHRLLLDESPAASCWRFVSMCSSMHA